MRVFKQTCGIRRKMNGDFQATAMVVIWYKLPNHQRGSLLHTERHTELKFTGIGNAGSVTDAINKALEHADYLINEFEKEVTT